MTLDPILVVDGNRADRRLGNTDHPTMVWNPHMRESSMISERCLGDSRSPADLYDIVHCQLSDVVVVFQAGIARK